MPQFCQLSIIDFVDFSVETANLFKKNKIFGIFSCQRPEMAVSVPSVMKHILPLTMALAIPAFGGTTAYVAPAPAPAPAPTLGWFIGGSFGQLSPDATNDWNGSDLTLGDISGLNLNDGSEWLGEGSDNYPDELTLGDYFDEYYREGWEDLNAADELENADILSKVSVDASDVDLNMYSLHFGRALSCAGGFDLAAYLEVGWLTGDMDVTGVATNLTPGDGYGNELVLFRDNLDLDIIPVTVNFMAEHALFGPVGAYLSGGIGYAWTQIKADDMDESDGGFYAQAAAGLVWNVNESVELFGGARWVYLQSLDFGDTGFELEDTFGWEVGARYNF